MKYLKLLLLPVLWGLYYTAMWNAIWYGFIGLTMIFGFKWYWFILSFTFLSFLISSLVFQIPVFAGNITHYLNTHIAFKVLTCLAGLSGLIIGWILVIQSPPEIVTADEAIPIWSGAWDYSWWKTLLMIYPLFVFSVIGFFMTVIGPFKSVSE